MLKIEFRAMGCSMAVFLDQHSTQAVKALEQVPVWFEEWEQALSRFRPDSELNQLNAAAGTAFEASPVLFEVVKAALDAAEWTGGIVVPTVLRSLERAGYNRSFEMVQAAASAAVVPAGLGTLAADAADAAVAEAETLDWRAVELDAQRGTIRLPAGVKLDLGGIAKGWAAWKTMQRLEGFGPTLVDAGGDLAVSGAKADGSAWPVSVADPLQMQDSLDLLALERCAVATSGIDYRRWRKDSVAAGRWMHHIIDPRTGQPAETDLMSVTLVAPDAVRAEAAAKVVLILGSQAGLEWLETQPGLNGLLALQDGRLVYSRAMHEHIWS